MDNLNSIEVHKLARSMGISLLLVDGNPKSPRELYLEIHNFVYSARLHKLELARALNIHEPDLIDDDSLYLLIQSALEENTRTTDSRGYRNQVVKRKRSKAEKTNDSESKHSKAEKTGDSASKRSKAEKTGDSESKRSKAEKTGISESKHSKAETESKRNKAEKRDDDDDVYLCPDTDITRCEECDGKLDPITAETIGSNYGMCCRNKCYSADTLIKMKSDPFTRDIFTNTDNASVKDTLRNALKKSKK